MKKIITLTLFFLCFMVSNAWALQSFVVKDIQIHGLESIRSETVETYLPIRRGQVLKSKQTPEILRSLYQTGFFDNITLSRNKNTLIITVVERPVIGQLKVSGNSIIPKDKLNTVMRTMDIIEGRIYNPVMLSRIKQGLLNQYYQMGYFNARVDVTTKPLERNRVLVRVDISEGVSAKVTRINIIGNRVFDEKTLIKQLDLTTPGLLTFYTKTDRYSEEKMDMSLEKLKNYYMDHGYLRVEVKSAQAEIAPDRKTVHITIVIAENQPYTVSRMALEGELIGPRSDYTKLMSLKEGDIFSRTKLIDTQKAITKYLGDQGYLFTNISIRPEVNDETHKVNIVMDVNHGKRAYVRQINFTDNKRTNDVVLRREIQQMEAAPVSLTNLENSKRNLHSLPYIKNAEMTVTPVSEDQVDVDYKVTESSSAQASLKLGYSELNGLLFGAGLNQNNFLGTGNTLGINFTATKVQQLFAIDYTDPYYTVDGISRSLNLSLSRVDPGEAERVANGYTINQFDLGVMYGIPVGNEDNVFNRVYFGFGYEYLYINANKSQASNQVLAYLDKHGNVYNQFNAKVGYARDSRDRAIFPTRGASNTFFVDFYAPLTASSLTFATVNYHGRWYIPLIHDFIFMTRADFGFGKSFNGSSFDFPFFKNYFAGGIDSVRGYLGYNLGPLDSRDNAYGGNILADASMNLILPNFISDSVRTSLFVDAGNVWATFDNKKFGGYSTNSGPVRYSVGVEADILTPFAPLALSFGWPINPRTSDEVDRFQLSLSANF